MTKILKKEDRVLESINATREDIENLYVVAILDKVTIHFEKKVFGKEEEFRKEAVELRQKHLKAVKCPKSWDMNTTGNPTVETIDGVTVSLIDVLAVIGQRDFYDQEELIYKLCMKYDMGREFKIIPVYEKKVADYWLYRV
mgnify:FL=1